MQLSHYTLEQPHFRYLISRRTISFDWGKDPGAVYRAEADLAVAVCLTTYKDIMVIEANCSFYILPTKVRCSCAPTNGSRSCNRTRDDEMTERHPVMLSAPHVASTPVCFDANNSVIRLAGAASRARARALGCNSQATRGAPSTARHTSSHSFRL
ncbi:unnamed protein product [Cercospora beticola]|nr:unnamed protein product [Cercospora beticola]